jgi:FtsP/CotA-like multicopper oxidase with cupredoxin domain
LPVAWRWPVPVCWRPVLEIGTGTGYNAALLAHRLGNKCVFSVDVGEDLVGLAHTATTGKVDLGGPTVSTWSYDGVVPGRELRVTAGDQVQVQVTNRLPQDTTVHWHGLFCPVWAMVAMAASVTTIFLNSLGTRPSLLFQAISSVGRHASNEQ